MRTIWKYQLEFAQEQFVEMPGGAVIQSVGLQDGVICLWAEVQSDRPNKKRSIWVFGTGHEMPADTKGPASWSLRFIGSVQQGVFVWHIYERVHNSEL